MRRRMPFIQLRSRQGVAGGTPYLLQITSMKFSGGTCRKYRFPAQIIQGGTRNGKGRIKTAYR